MKIKICKKFNNIKKLEKKLLQAFPDDTVSIKSCISMCKVCKSQPTARVKKKKCKAKRISKLVRKLEAYSLLCPAGRTKTIFTCDTSH
jgi:hypothetical protein